MNSYVKKSEPVKLDRTNWRDGERFAELDRLIARGPVSSLIVELSAAGLKPELIAEQEDCTVDYVYRILAGARRRAIARKARLARLASLALLALPVFAADQKTTVRNLETKVASGDVLIADLRYQLDQSRASTINRVDAAKAGLESLNRELMRQLEQSRAEAAAARLDIERRDQAIRELAAKVAKPAEATDRDRAQLRALTRLQSTATRADKTSRSQADIMLEMQAELHDAINTNAGLAQQAVIDSSRRSEEAVIKSDADKRANEASRIAIYGSWGTGIIGLIGLYIVNRRHTAKLDESITTAKEAWTEANSVNAKIASLGLQIKDQKR